MHLFIFNTYIYFDASFLKLPEYTVFESKKHVLLLCAAFLVDQVLDKGCAKLSLILCVMFRRLRVVINLLTAPSLCVYCTCTPKNTRNHILKSSGTDWPYSV